MKTKNQIFHISLFLVPLLFLIGCSDSGNTIKIGCSAPLTGDQAKIGTDLCNGVKLAVIEANEKNILPGLRFEAYVLDDQHNPTQAVNVANRFSSDSRLVGVVGHLNSSATKPASAIYHEARIPEITPASTNPDLSAQGFDTFFRTCATDTVQGPVGAQYAKKIGKTRIFIIDDKTTYGKGLADEFEKEARKIGLTVLGHEGLTQGDKDFSPLITTIKSQGPDLIFFGGIYPEAALLIRQARSQGLETVFMGGDGIADPILIKLATPRFSEGTYVTQIGLDAKQNPRAASFVKNFESHFGTVGLYSGLAYDSANMMIEAIKRAGSPEREKVLKALREIKDFEGISGKIIFDEKGDNLNRLINIYRVTNGRLEYIETIGSGSVSPSA